MKILNFVLKLRRMTQLAEHTVNCLPSPSLFKSMSLHAAQSLASCSVRINTEEKGVVRVCAGHDKNMDQ